MNRIRCSGYCTLQNSDIFVEVVFLCVLNLTKLVNYFDGLRRLLDTVRYDFARLRGDDVLIG